MPILPVKRGRMIRVTICEPSMDGEAASLFVSYWDADGDETHQVDVLRVIGSNPKGLPIWVAQCVAQFLTATHGHQLTAWLRTFKGVVELV